jgi:hypothetical protein
MMVPPCAGMLKAEARVKQITAALILITLLVAQNLTTIATILK